jgi:hypothetical protein
MSYLTCYRLRSISTALVARFAFGISILTAIVPVSAKEVGNPNAFAKRLVEKRATEAIEINPSIRSTVPSKPGLDIGLQPIIAQDVPLKPSSQPIANTPASNQKQPLGLGVSPQIGTLGIGVSVAKSLSPQVNGRLGFNFGNLGASRTDSGISYDSQLNLSSVQLFGDYYPFSSSGFRVTGGLVAQNNTFSVTSKPSNGSYTIDNTQYSTSAVGNLTGEYKYANSIAPYVGIGIGKSTNDGFGFNADVGVMFTGAPKVSLNASNPIFNNSPDTRTRLDNQVRQTESDLKGFNVYPVISVGLSYGF